MLMVGFVYAWSILSAPIAAEYPQWSASELSLSFTLCMAFFCLGGLGGGFALRVSTPRRNLLLAALLFMCGFAIASRAQIPAMLYLGYGGLCGCASGVAYNAVMSTVPRWFPKRQGLVSGMLLMAFGSSSIVIGALFTALLPDSAGSWRRTLLCLGAAMAVVIAACSFCQKQPETGDTSSAAGAGGMTLPQTLRCPAAWVIFIWAALLSGAGLAVIGQARAICLSVDGGLSAAELSLLVGVISVCNGLGRVLIGAVFDRLGYRWSMLMVGLLFISGAALILAASCTASGLLLVMSFVLLGLGYGGVPISLAALTRDFFGAEHYSENFAAINLNLLVSSLGGTVSAALYDSFGSFVPTFILLAACAIISTFLLLHLKRPQFSRKMT